VDLPAETPRDYRNSQSWRKKKARAEEGRNQRTLLPDKKQGGQKGHGSGVGRMGYAGKGNLDSNSVDGTALNQAKGQGQQGVAGLSCNDLYRGQRTTKEKLQKKKKRKRKHKEKKKGQQLQAGQGQNLGGQQIGHNELSLPEGNRVYCRAKDN